MMEGNGSDEGYGPSPSHKRVQNSMASAAHHHPVPKPPYKRFDDYMTSEEEGEEEYGEEEMSDEEIYDQYKRKMDNKYGHHRGYYHHDEFDEHNMFGHHAAY